MNFTPNKENIAVLKGATDLLIQLINLVGQRATGKPFTEKALMKNCIIDLLKKINANLNGFSILLDHFGEPNKNLLKIPLSLCLRGAVSDCLTGIYLYSLSEDTKSLENEVTLLSVDYAKYLRDAEEFILRYVDKLDEAEVKEALDKWTIEFKKNQPQLFKSTDDAEWSFKKHDVIRNGSKFNPGKRVTEKDKFDWIKLLDNDLEYVPLYMLFRSLSQYQHYSFASRNLIDEFPFEDFKRFVSGIALITSSCWAFFYALDQISHDVNEFHSQISKKLSHFLELE